MSEHDSEGDRESVAAALRAAGLPPSPADISALADGYPELRAMVASLYEVEEAEGLSEPMLDP
jgi:hypothetical protein